MAATEKQNIWPYQGDGNAAPRKVVRKIAASQGIYMPGAMFYMSTDGTLKLSDTSDGTGDKYQYVACAGVSAELAANTEIRVYEIDTSDRWCIFIENNDADAAAAQSYVGEEYGIRISSTAGQIGYATLDVNNANAAFRVDDIWPNVSPSDPNYGTTSDSPGIAIGHFLPAVLQGERS